MTDILGLWEGYPFLVAIGGWCYCSRLLRDTQHTLWLHMLGKHCHTPQTRTPACNIYFIDKYNTSGSQDSIIYGLGYRLDDLQFRSQYRQVILFFSKTSRQTLKPSQPPIQWVMGPLSLGEKRPGHETDHSLSSCVKVKNEWSCASTLPCVLSWHVQRLQVYIQHFVFCFRKQNQ
jgi:hypothetical protein